MYPVDFLLSDDDWPTISYQLILQSKEEYFLTKCCNTRLSTKENPMLKNLYDDNELKDWKTLENRNGRTRLGDIFILMCPNCHKSVAVWLGKWWSIDTVLQSNDSAKEKFCQVRTPGEFVALWCLNSVIFGEWENDNENLQFLSIFRGEFAKIYWENGIAAGFYTLKLKGTSYDENQVDAYCMPVIDLVFVRKPYRRLGIGLSALEDVISMFPNQEIGLSSPISESMFYVIYKFIKRHPEMKTLIWETQWIGCEGFRKNVWFTLSKMLSKSRIIPDNYIHVRR